MLLTMAVSLYTSRIILLTLGIEDYGIYSLVAGFIVLFEILNGAISSATQRFLTFEIGRKDSGQIRNVFSMSINIHIILAFVILILGETIGLWFLNTQLVIPPERMEAAQWVFQFSLFAVMVSILSSPYNAIIIAYERMGVFAVVSIISVVLKLVIVFMLQWFGFDKLKLYAILTFGVTLIIRIIYGAYCKRNFEESKFSFYWDKVLFKKLFNHVGWMLFGTTSAVLAGQGVNILMNIFFGVTVNAARGIAYTVKGSVTSFITNFMVAVNPQIIKNYAQENFTDMYNLVFRSSKFSFFLMLYLSLPIILLADTILHWWLKIVPEYAVIFSRLIIIDLFFTILFSPIGTVSQATGRIKPYQLIITIGNLLIFGLSYLFFKMGYPSYFTFIIMIVISFISLFARLIILKSQISFPIQKYIEKVLQPIALVVLFSAPLPLLVYYFIDDNVIQFFLVGTASVLSTSLGIWWIGFNKSEKVFIRNKIYEIKNKIFK